MQKERYPAVLTYEAHDGGLIPGFDFSLQESRVNVLYNDKSEEDFIVDNVTSQYFENPLNGFTEVTIKIQMRKE